MKCHEIREMVSPYIDDELSYDEKELFEAHIAGCPLCREELDETRSLHNMFSSADRFHAPSRFSEKIMATLDESKTQAGSGLWQTFSVPPLVLRSLEVAFALIVIFLGIISGSFLVSGRADLQQQTVEESFSLDLFQATPPGSVGGAYVSMVGGNR